MLQLQGLSRAAIPHVPEFLEGELPDAWVPLRIKRKGAETFDKADGIVGIMIKEGAEAELRSDR